MHICNAKVNASSPDAAAIAVHKLTLTHPAACGLTPR